ncbi:MAG: hypothetical protein LBI86_04175, partial [Treponema sp.]|nr:hypothetical protein [Treponema sp.]
SGNYVGGIVGNVEYSSIENSYSTGNVGGYTSVGGVAGEVFHNSSITDSYSTGTVIGANAVGGVVGEVSGGSSSIEYCAALTLSVEVGASDAGRVVGNISGTNTINGNVAWSGLTVIGSTVSDTSQKDGTGRTNTAFHTASGFPFTVNAAPSPWVYTPGTLPILNGLAGQNSALPAHLQ